jgi:integrase
MLAGEGLSHRGAAHYGAVDHGLHGHTRVAGLRDVRVHDLRHTYASLARSAGADMKLLQVTMGQASIMVTAHTYADLYDSDLDRVANALDGLGD